MGSIFLGGEVIFCRAQTPFFTFSISREVLRPSLKGSARTFPPQDLTSGAPTISWGCQSPPLTRTSGLIFKMICSGVSSLNQVT